MLPSATPPQWLCWATSLPLTRHMFLHPSFPSSSMSSPLLACQTRRSSTTTCCRTSLVAPLPPRAFFLAHGHQVTILEWLDLDTFIAMSLGAIICPISTIPTLVLSEGGQLLINQAVACLMSLVDDVALGDCPTSAIPRSFLNCYLELLLVASSLFATVLLSSTDVPALSHPAPSSFPLHGGPHSHPDPDGVDVTASWGIQASPRAFYPPADLVFSRLACWHCCPPQWGVLPHCL